MKYLLLASIFLVVMFNSLVFANETGIMIEAETYIREIGGAVQKVSDRVESSGKNCVVNWKECGHALEWEINVPETKAYKMVLRYANGRSWTALRDIWIDGKNPSKEFARVELPPTGGFSKDENNWQNLTVTNDNKQPVMVELTKGAHIVRITCIGSVINKDGSSNLDKLAFLGKNVNPDILGRTGELPYISQTIPNGTIYLDLVFDKAEVQSELIYSEPRNSQGQIQKLSLDIYQPTGDNRKSRPAILFLHGGSFVGGDKADLIDICLEFARRGYVVVNANYRIRSDARSDLYGAVRDAGSDVIAAFNWIRKNSEAYRINPEWITVAGSSAGATAVSFTAYDARFAALNPPRYFCVIDMYGGTGTILMREQGPPLLIIHGTADKTCPYSESVSMQTKAQQKGIECEFFTMEQGGHGYHGRFYKEIIAKIADFIYRHLK